jgi:hypothetical protein
LPEISPLKKCAFRGICPKEFVRFYPTGSRKEDAKPHRLLTVCFLMFEALPTVNLNIAAQLGSSGNKDAST